MLVMRKFLLYPLLNSSCAGLELQMSDIDFILSILVVILLTASGNIINDYFDVKVDKINKPDRVIVGKQVKRRVAMMLHQVLNIGAIAISAYLCYTYNNWWPIAIPILVATLLWWYSPIFKKMNFLGNLVVAICVSVIPIWAAVFEIAETASHYNTSVNNISKLTNEMWYWTGMYSAFAFLLTLSREALKDLEDLKGDKAGHYRTMPIVLGEQFTKRYAAFIMMLCAALVALCYFLLSIPLNHIGALVSLVACVLLPALLTIFFALKGNEKKNYSLASAFAKATMAGGIVLVILLGIFFWTC